MRLLCVSDIHGRLDALAAVLATAERRSFNKLLVAGDIVFPGPHPLETWRRLAAAGAILVQGVSDKALATLDPKDLHASTEHEKKMIERMQAVRAELGDVILTRLKRLPTHFRMPLEDGGELLLVHGSPVDPADVVVCGMSHTPFEREVMGCRIVNVGSVGEAPDQRPGGGTVAHATWIESTPSGVLVEQITVPLDAEPLRIAAFG